mmetsp:Transcript_87164/g.208493  ORF Transcript_87164/g.208493 Transcript_87164/m.208493 type:complete len:254 (+) Transcript_87164:1250-2011(+)
MIAARNGKEFSSQAAPGHPRPAESCGLESGSPALLLAVAGPVASTLVLPHPRFDLPEAAATAPWRYTGTAHLRVARKSGQCRQGPCFARCTLSNPLASGSEQSRPHEASPGEQLDQEWERKSAPLPQEPESVQYAGLAVARHAAPPLRPNAACRRSGWGLVATLAGHSQGSTFVVTCTSRQCDGQVGKEPRAASAAIGPWKGSAANLAARPVPCMAPGSLDAANPAIGLAAPTCRALPRVLQEETLRPCQQLL